FEFGLFLVKEFAFIINFFQLLLQLFAQFLSLGQFTTDLGFLIPSTFFGLCYLLLLIDNDLLMFGLKLHEFFLRLIYFVLLYILAFQFGFLDYIGPFPF